MKVVDSANRIGYTGVDRRSYGKNSDKFGGWTRIWLRMGRIRFIGVYGLKERIRSVYE